MKTIPPITPAGTGYALTVILGNLLQHLIASGKLSRAEVASILMQSHSDLSAQTTVGARDALPIIKVFQSEL
jgi:hypothetical protein